jgi:phenylalanyl-tRNA synthetase beta subunit
LADYLGLPDARFELKLTPNRADCFSIRGIAFDLAAALQTRVVPMQIPEVPVTSGSRIEVSVAADKDCPRYCGRVIEGLNPSAVTPLWMSEALKRSGIRPLSPLVDITQFVMLELGQPMHAFDADTLKGAIGVRRAVAGESCVLLDGKQVELAPEFTVITDADRAIAVAGVMGGGIGSGVGSGMGSSVGGLMGTPAVMQALANAYRELPQTLPQSAGIGMHTYDPYANLLAVQQAMAMQNTVPNAFSYRMW